MKELRSAVHEIRDAMKPLLEEDSELDPAQQQELRDYGKQFRHAMKSAWHQHSHGSHTDLGAFVAEVKAAFGELTNAVQEMASRMSGLEEEEPVVEEGTTGTVKEVPAPVEESVEA